MSYCFVFTSLTLCEYYHKQNVKYDTINATKIGKNLTF